LAFRKKYLESVEKEEDDKNFLPHAKATKALNAD